jgi:phenylalanine ammonia-lyase
MIHHGGAFQAFSVTQAMEATRLTLEHFGKLSFAQLTELVNCTQNRGLPSCLAGGANPSLNFFAKGLDTSAAFVERFRG